MGRQTGWEAIAGNIYRAGMGETFSERELTQHDVAVNVFRDTAVAEFNRVVDAIRRDDGSAIQTDGRETQVYVRMDGGEWRLVRFEYSEEPD